MTYCDHGINHSGERHGCDGCCKHKSKLCGYDEGDIKIFLVGHPEREALERVVEAVRTECAKFKFPDEDRPELYEALKALDVLRVK